MIRAFIEFARAVWSDVMPLLRAWIVASAAVFAVVSLLALVSIF